jgi:hypothetical protein
MINAFKKSMERIAALLWNEGFAFCLARPFSLCERGLNFLKKGIDKTLIM